MSGVVIFPDVEALLVDYLTAEFAGRGVDASAHTQIPADRPARFVTIPRVGGPARNRVVDMATISVDSWGDRPKDAHDLAQLVRMLFHRLPGMVLDGYPVYRVTEFTGPGNLPDNQSRQSRYTQSFSVFVRGFAAT